MIDSAVKQFDFQTFENDLLNLRLYTLENGLKVYLTVNKDEPRIYTSVAFRAGSKNDPSQTTGLAHYMEHMLFKGTSDVGTLDWEKESKLLDQIAELYEQHLEETDADKKLEIYKNIDKLSFEAAQLAIPNEYDKIVSGLGAKGTNAYTSYEKTVYLNDIPANELDKWAQLEANRFKKLVLRLFHTEMETVYEEYNRYLDNDFMKSWRAIYQGLYPKHPYSTPVIGKGEHIKNPSMNNIYNFFYQYYRPNNAAICLAGDFDPDQAIATIEKHFGSWRPTEIPEFKFEKEDPITEPVILENLGNQADHLYFAYRFDGANSEESLMLKLIGNMFSNDIAGLLDLNLLQQQKVLQAYSYEIVNVDYSQHVFFGMPKQGQTLEEVQELILGQIEKVKKGEFEEWLIPAVVNHLRYKQIRNFRTNKARAGFLVESFTLGLDYERAISSLDRMEKITKEDIVAFANKYYQNNYVVAYKRSGLDNRNTRVEKPPLTPIPINRNVQSVFSKQLLEKESERLTPMFLDYQKDIENSDIELNGKKIPFSYVKNEKDETFKLYYLLDMGERHSQKLQLALRYLPFLGTSKYSASEIHQQFFRLGIDFRVECHSRNSYVCLLGREKSIKEGIELLEHILTEVEVDTNAYQQFVGDILKKRADKKLAKDTILHKGMYNYAVFGPQSPFTNILSEKELTEQNPQELCDIIKSLSSYPMRVFYHGQQPDSVKQYIGKTPNFSMQKLEYPAIKTFEEKETKNSKVFLVDYEQTQVEILLVTKKELFNKNNIALQKIFNEYFGAGLSSIVFQEIREAKALAYSAYAWYSTPSFKDQSHFIKAYIGTQPDKLQEAVEVFVYLMNNMPQAHQQFNIAKDAALKRIESERITDESVFWSYESAKNKGLTEDIRKQIYQQISELTIDDLQQFFDKNIKGVPFNYLVIGKKELLDSEELSKLGIICELDLEEIFGY